MRNILSKSIELTKWTIGLTLSAALVACGGSGGGGPPPAVQVANANVVAPVSATTVAALVPAAGAAPIVATFANGFSGTAAGAAVNLTGATTLTFAAPAAGTTAPIFNITNPAGTASGATSFGSCIFTVTASTIPALPVGTVLTVNPCTLTVNTSGDLSNGTTNTDSVTLTLGTIVSGAFTLPVTISSGGTVTVGGVTVGSVTLTPTTGAGG